MRIPKIGLDIANTDAYRWHQRSSNFLSALKTGNFKETYQHYQPGVTLMWISALTRQLIFSTQFYVLDNKEPLTLEHTEGFLMIHGISKGVLVVILSFLLVYQIKTIKKIQDEKTALLFGIFVAIEPYLIGIDRWFHLTSLENYLVFSAFLTLLLYRKSSSRNLLFLAGIFSGFAILTKVTSAIVIPLFIYVLLSGEKNLKEIVQFLTITVVVVVLFFPALLSSPVYVFNKIIAAVTDAISQTYQRQELTLFQYLTFYDFVLLMKSSPLTLLLFFLGIYKLWNNKDAKITLLYFLSFYLVFTISKKKIDRYVVSMLIPMIYLVSIYLSSLDTKILRYLIFFGGAHLLLIVFLFHPVYSAYNSPIFGGTKTAKKLSVYDNSGEYFADAARYLNTEGRRENVFVPDGEASLKYYYKGIPLPEFSNETEFIVVSDDIDRIGQDVAAKFGCKQSMKSFGSMESYVVYIYACD